jgi:hypothetical protein
VLRLPSLAEDFWELQSGENRHREHPERFEIPPVADRTNLERGRLAKLIFNVEVQTEAGAIEHLVERMWVLVTERVGSQYIGVLANRPQLSAGFYLALGAEVPFGPEHVIDIDEPPDEWVRENLDEPPTRRWPRRTQSEPAPPASRPLRELRV